MAERAGDRADEALAGRHLYRQGRTTWLHVRALVGAVWTESGHGVQLRSEKPSAPPRGSLEAR